jgi:hypothetical protein
MSQHSSHCAIECLLKSPNILNGIALVSFQGHAIDCRGELTSVSQTYWNQFKNLFTLKRSDADVITRLTMPSRSCDDDVFIVHRRGDTRWYPCNPAAHPCIHAFFFCHYTAFMQLQNGTPVALWLVCCRTEYLCAPTKRHRVLIPSQI